MCADMAIAATRRYHSCCWILAVLVSWSFVMAYQGMTAATKTETTSAPESGGLHQTTRHYTTLRRRFVYLFIYFIIETWPWVSVYHAFSEASSNLRAAQSSGVLRQKAVKVLGRHDGATLVNRDAAGHSINCQARGPILGTGQQQVTDWAPAL